MSRRPVIHPCRNEAGQLNTTHYRAHGCCAGRYLDGPELVMPTEVLHGLYDGGHGAGLADLWRRMLDNPPRHAGGRRHARRDRQGDR